MLEQPTSLVVSGARLKFSSYLVTLTLLYFASFKDF
jgi:hypothetical protein